MKHFFSKSPAGIGVGSLLSIGLLLVPAAGQAQTW